MNPSFGRFGDAAENFEQRCFTGAVPTDDSEHLASSHLEADVLQSPEVFARRKRGVRGPASTQLRRGRQRSDVAGQLFSSVEAKEIFRLFRYDIAQCGVTLGALMAQRVTLT